MTPELSATFELRCGDVHPVRCNVALHAVTREELTSRIRAHGAMVHGFTSTWYDPARIATITKAAALHE
jgi:predicted small metal-binding protein